MSNITLTTTQHAMLDHAIGHTEGRIDWFPENVKGGARQKVLQGLFNRALITPHGQDWLVAAEGYDALGCARPTACMIVPEPELDAAVNEANNNATACHESLAGTNAPATQINATQGQPAPTTGACEQPDDAAQEAFNRAVECAKEGLAIRVAHEQVIANVLKRESKQATILQMLNHPQGATIAQICEATGWQAHTVRGTFSGALKKKLGLTITSSKPQGGVRTYHVSF
ncbi:DUF3489 domain-containing protein [Rhodoferax sp.]|uniref:DUF3489 domain-containing protein n=1 Tax=Rhodoferax sp. TaxID=50421 RepID=UPI0019E27E04|nr:DUF3489 domain-containing protein [Rhodoferax sp.]MBE0474892.1 DUF3489 domain-containing protein [Rhodoferax sp.]